MLPLGFKIAPKQDILIFKDLKINDHTIATQLLLVLKKEYNSWKDYDGDDDDDSINDQD